MPRRNSVIPVAKADPPCEGIHRCQSCGVGLARWRRQYVCSWCKGDPSHGGDGYFADIIDDYMAGVCAGLSRSQVRDLLNDHRKVNMVRI